MYKNPQFYIPLYWEYIAVTNQIKTPDIMSPIYILMELLKTWL